MDEKAKKHTLRRIPYGLYILTARTEEDVPGLERGIDAATVSWLSQASFDPPRVVASLRRESTIWRRVQASGTFAINFLGKGQKDLASGFFRHVEPGERAWGDHAFHLGLTGAPILDEVPAYLECSVVQAIDAGDHTLFLGDIVEAGTQNDLEPLDLAQTGWHYGG
jgi:flavin reductase (DIM6/NTAB) family NADH-FMN oxidoreductase RutF